jgi:uncharacterized protein VirK/YbjX
VSVTFKPLLELCRASASEWRRPAGWLSLLRAARMLLHPRKVSNLLELDIVTKSLVESRGPAAFSFVTSPHFLSRALGLRQRIDCALHHYRYEQATFSAAYVESVYHGDGLELWRHQAAEHVFSIRLMVGNDNLFEGCLSVVAFVDDQRVCVMSFSYVDAEIFGLPAGPMLFVTRRQSGRHPEHQQLFARAFNHSSPPYFCLAAIAGIAIANGTREIAAIRHQTHPTYSPANAEALRKSYDEFWEVFNASEADEKAYRIPVPLEARDLAEVSAAHRRRARKRREHWSAVEEGTRATIRRQLARPESAGGVGSRG